MYLTSVNCPGCDGPALFVRVQRDAVLYECRHCKTKCLLPPDGRRSLSMRKRQRKRQCDEQGSMRVATLLSMGLVPRSQGQDLTSEGVFLAPRALLLTGKPVLAKPA